MSIIVEVDQPEVVVEVVTPEVTVEVAQHTIDVQVSGAPGPPGADGQPGPPGADSTVPGPPGPTAVSADAGNTAVLGSDSLIYVPLSFDQATADARYVNGAGDTIPGLLVIDRGPGAGVPLLQFRTNNGQQIISSNGSSYMTFSNGISVPVLYTGGIGFTQMGAQVDMNMGSIIQAGKFTTTSATGHFRNYSDYNAGQGQADQGFIHTYANRTAGGAPQAAFQVHKAGDITENPFMVSSNGYAWLKNMQPNKPPLTLFGASGQTVSLFEIRDLPGTLQFSVGPPGGSSAFAQPLNAPEITVTNADRLKYGLTVNRSVDSTTTSDAEIFRVLYKGTRATWANEKGNLRTSNEASKAEVALKVIGASQAEGGTGDALQVMDLAGNVAVRVGVLGRLNAAKGMRLVGDTIQIRDSTEADESTISQALGGPLLLNPKTSVSINNKKITALATPTEGTDAVNKTYADTKWTMWTGTQAAYDAIVTKDASTLYVIV